MKTTPFLAGLAAMVLSTASAQAQAVRTWVSGVGDDANPCSRTAPCKTFAGAISKTAAKGEINVLDPGAFGAVTITKSISIISEDTQAGILATSGSSGVVINAAATDEVVLRGLDFEGSGTGGNGIRILNAGSVIVENSTIADFVTAGINLQSPSATRLYVRDVTLSDNAIGLLVDASGQNANRAFVDNTRFFDNATTGIKVDGAQSVVLLSKSYLASSGSNLIIDNGGQINSYGDNVIRTGTPNATSTYK